MNRELLLQHFDRISEAPDAIPRLRRFILDLAVRGKLVEQDPSDEPASELLKRIQTEKARLVKEGVIKKQDYFPEIGEVEFPYTLPSSWLWCRIGALGRTQTGTTPPKGKSEYFGTFIPFIKPGDIYQDRVDYSNEGLSKIGINKSGRLAQTGSILMVCIGTIGKCQRIDRDCSFNQQINSLSPYSETDSSYLLNACQSDFFQKSAWAASACTTIAILNKGKWEHLLLPLPPLDEQRRIVAKVDELMALCDQLEAERNEREARRDRLVASSLNRISTAMADEAKYAARFHLDHLPRLTTRTEHIKQLRQTILNLAVRGRLVPQDQADGDARQRLTEAFKVRNAHVKKGSLAKKCLSDAAWLNESPFPIPSQWAFASFDHLAAPVPNALKAGPFGSALKKEFYVTAGYKIYGQEQVIKQDAHFGDYYISDKKFKELKTCEVKPGDLLISLVGTIGKVLILPPDSKAGIINPRLIKISLNREVVAAEYIQILLQAPWVREFLFAESHGTTMDVLSLTILRNLPVPLPPLAEQHRIVAKVDELMALCDQLEANLNTTERDSCRLLEAVLRDALEPAMMEAA